MDYQSIGLLEHGTLVILDKAAGASRSFNSHSMSFSKAPGNLDLIVYRILEEVANRLTHYYILTIKNFDFAGLFTYIYIYILSSFEKLYPEVKVELGRGSPVTTIGFNTESWS